jgi:hypothetical protein
MLSQSIQLLVPEYFVLPGPISHLFQLSKISPANTFSSDILDMHESTFFQDADMFGDSGPANGKFTCNAIEVMRPTRQQFNDLSAGGISDRLEHISSHNVTIRLQK